MTKLKSIVRAKFESQKEFAKLIGISEPMATNYLTGKTQLTLDMAVIMAEKLGCEVMDIYERKVVADEQDSSL